MQRTDPLLSPERNNIFSFGFLDFVHWLTKPCTRSNSFINLIRLVDLPFFFWYIYSCLIKVWVHLYLVKCYYVISRCSSDRVRHVLDVELYLLCFIKAPVLNIHQTLSLNSFNAKLWTHSGLIFIDLYMLNKLFTKNTVLLINLSCSP